MTDTPGELRDGRQLRRVLKPLLLAIFFATVAIGIIIIGFLFNAIA